MSTITMELLASEYFRNNLGPFEPVPWEWLCYTAANNGVFIEPHTRSIFWPAFSATYLKRTPDPHRRVEMRRVFDICCRGLLACLETTDFLETLHAILGKHGPREKEVGEEWLLPMFGRRSLWVALRKANEVTKAALPYWRLITALAITLHFLKVSWKGIPESEESHIAAFFVGISHLPPTFCMAEKQRMLKSEQVLVNGFYEFSLPDGYVGRDDILHCLQHCRELRPQWFISILDNLDDPDDYCTDGWEVYERLPPCPMSVSECLNSSFDRLRDLPLDSGTPVHFSF
ncbi:hypothetical protein EXIGLDRAFT_475371 [Exidia glandulosa HHB12029]|uniref:Uncharacterized protein n=1 Tax=Exidia glandulosa HHB12029 TaxID=1314781 RepID=A0A166NL83_EXIGL|nr:hypothetical protein EXIGLDRAFT_475371 [Exidia glandulosa HHB12029]